MRVPSSTSLIRCFRSVSEEMCVAHNIYIYIYIYIYRNIFLCTMQGIKTAIADRNGIRQNHPPIIQIHYM